MERNQTGFPGEKGKRALFSLPGTAQGKGKPGKHHDPLHCGWQNALRF